jgi:hypothetical protein
LAELALPAVAAIASVPAVVAVAAAHPGEDVPPAPAGAATPGDPISTLAYAAATASEAPKPSKGKRWREEESADEDEGHDQCIICHEDFNNSGDHKVVSLACGHLFGNCCILKWLGERKACPSCNKKAARRDIRPIFFSRLVLRDRTEEEALQRELERQRQQRQRAEEALKRRQQDLVKSQVEKKSLEAELKALKQQLKAAQQQWATTAAAAAAAHPPHTTTTAPLAPSSTVPFGIGGGRQHTKKPPPHPFPSSSSSHATAQGEGMLSAEGLRGCTTGSLQKGVPSAGSRTNSVWSVLGRFGLREGTALASAEGEGCVLVSCVSEVAGGVGGGQGTQAWTLCKVNYLSRLHQYMRTPLHSKAITDCKVEPREGRTVLTSSLDKTVRLTCIASDNLVCAWTLPVAVWTRARAHTHTLTLTHTRSLTHSLTHTHTHTGMEHVLGPTRRDELLLWRDAEQTLSH